VAGLVSYLLKIKGMETTRKEDFERIRELIDAHNKNTFSAENELELFSLLQVIWGSTYSDCKFFKTYKQGDSKCIDILLVMAKIELVAHLLNKIINNLNSLSDNQTQLISTLEKQISVLNETESSLNEIILKK
jgi:hypothetical protein